MFKSTKTNMHKTLKARKILALFLFIGVFTNTLF